MGDSCELCALYPARPVAVIAVQPERESRIYLLKLPANASEFAAQLDAMDDEIIGLCINVARVSKDPADGLELSLAGREFARAVPCAKYCSAIGRRTYELAVAALQAAPPLQLAQ